MTVTQNTPDPALQASGSEVVTTGPSGWRRAYPWLVVTGVSVGGLALRQLIVPVIRWGSSVDDEGQMRVAAALLSGQWLGEWGTQPVPHITLAKGPGFPLFLAGINHGGLSPHLAAYLLYLLGAILLMLGLRPVIGWGWGIALYAALAFSPHVMSVAFSRPYRDQLVTALALCAFGSSVYLGPWLARPGQWSWSGRLRVAASTLVLAVALAWLAITRADTIWIQLTCLAVIANAVLPAARCLRRRGWVRIGTASALVVIMVVGLSSGVAAINERRYGVRLTDDYSQGAFADAVRAWSSVQASGGEPFMLVTKPQRQAVYAVSPAAREVRDRLEDPKNPWAGVGCGWRPESWPRCTEFGAFFGWAIRNAAFESGESTAADFQQYFARLAREIEAACAAGTLTCGSRGLSADLPPLSQISARVVFSAAVNLANGGLVFEDNLEAPQQPVPQDSAVVQTWEQTVPSVTGLVDLLNAGQNPDTLVQQSTVNVLKRLYSILAFAALAVVLFGLVSGALWRSHVGRVALVALAGWLANIAIVAVLFAATNRQFVAVVPSYTVPGQAFLITGLVLSVYVCVERAVSTRASRRRPQTETTHVSTTATPAVSAPTTGNPGPA